MIDELLPSAIVAVEASEHRSDVVLFPAEQAAIARSVPKRRLEYTTARACARQALAQLGLPPAAILNGVRDEPGWPEGVVGSITHCEGYTACAIARSHEAAAIGIDAEPHAALRRYLVGEIARAEELPWLAYQARRNPEVHWDRLLFSAKEAVYKAWFPLAKRWLDFKDAIVTIDPCARTFSARLLVPGPVLSGRRVETLAGSWLIRDELVLTAVVLRGERPSANPTTR